MKRKLLFVMSIVLLLALAAIPVAAEDYPDPGQGSTYTVLQNKTNESANATVTYYNQLGNPQAGPNPTIAGNGSYMILPAGTQLPQDFNGAAVVSSSKALASTANTRWTGSVNGDGYEMGLYSGVAEGSGRICFATLAKHPAFVASFAIQNTGTGTADITVDYYSRAGVHEGAYNDSIPPGTQHTYDLRTPSATVPNLGEEWNGSAIATVTNGQTVAGVGVINQSGRSSTYNAANCSGITGQTELVVPSQFRGFDGTDPTDTAAYYLWSAINVHNLEGEEATVDLEYIPRDAGDPGLTFSDVKIPAYSVQGWNTRPQQGQPDPFEALGGGSDNGVRDGWAGTVLISSDKGIAATVNTQWRQPLGVEAGFYSAVSRASNDTLFFVPDVRRIKAGDGNFPRLSAIIIQNTGNSGTDVRIRFYDAAGVEKHSYEQPLAAAAGMGCNTRSGTCGTEALGDDFEGTAVVESNGQPLAVVLNNIDTNPFARATTNGIPE